MDTHYTNAVYFEENGNRRIYVTKDDQLFCQVFKTEDNICWLRLQRGNLLIEFPVSIENMRDLIKILTAVLVDANIDAI